MWDKSARAFFFGHHFFNIFTGIQSGAGAPKKLAGFFLFAYLLIYLQGLVTQEKFAKIDFGKKSQMKSFCAEALGIPI